MSRTRENEYWEWARRVDLETQPTFRFPADPYIGAEPAEDRIKRNIRASRNKTAELSAQYEAWLDKLAKDQAERIKEQLRAKMEADADFANAREANARKRAAHVRALKRQSDDVAAGYFDWLEDTKREVARRPQSAPPAQHSTAKSVEQFVEEKIALLKKDQHARDKEYSAFLESIRKPSFRLPLQKCLTAQEREDLIAEQAQKKKRLLAQNTAEYNKWLGEMEQKHRDRVVEALREKLAADKKFRREREAFQAHLDEKAAEAGRQRENLALEHEEFLRTMEARAKAKPLMIEEHFIPCVWAKKAPHRRELHRSRSQPIRHKR